MNFLFLYTELADYTLACLRALREQEPASQIMVIHYPVNPEAPFLFDFKNIGEFICVKDFGSYEEFESATRKFEADKIVCSGWVHKWYLRFCRQQKNSLCILTLDNKWTGNIKQQVLRIIAGFSIVKIFKLVWVPGLPQVEYAEKIGFKRKNILTGYYSCDTEKFGAYYHQYKEKKSSAFPHRFLCVARYIPGKGYTALWDAFVEWKNETANDWELWCAGTGIGFSERRIHPSIKHLGFVQKNDWEKVIEETGVFVLASLQEPWGVVVHEFASAGYPLLLSKNIGAASEFLSNENGFTFDPLNKQELIQLFNTVSGLTNEHLNQKGAQSHNISLKITPASWAQTLITART